MKRKNAGEKEATSSDVNGAWSFMKKTRGHTSLFGKSEVMGADMNGNSNGNAKGVEDHSQALSRNEQEDSACDSFKPFSFGDSDSTPKPKSQSTVQPAHKTHSLFKNSSSSSMDDNMSLFKNVSKASESPKDDLPHSMFQSHMTQEAPEDETPRSIFKNSIKVCEAPEEESTASTESNSTSRFSFMQNAHSFNDPRKEPNPSQDTEDPHSVFQPRSQTVRAHQSASHSFSNSRKESKPSQDTDDPHSALQVRGQTVRVHQSASQETVNAHSLSKGVSSQSRQLTTDDEDGLPISSQKKENSIAQSRPDKSPSIITTATEKAKCIPTDKKPARITTPKGTDTRKLHHHQVHEGGRFLKFDSKFDVGDLTSTYDQDGFLAKLSDAMEDVEKWIPVFQEELKQRYSQYVDELVGNLRQQMEEQTNDLHKHVQNMTDAYKTNSVMVNQLQKTRFAQQQLSRFF